MPLMTMSYLRNTSNIYYSKKETEMALQMPGQKKNMTMHHKK